MNLNMIVERYDEDGFVIVPGVFSAQDVAAIEANLDGFIRDVVPILAPGDVYFENSPARPVKSIFRMNERSDFFRALMTDERLLRLVRALWPQGDVIQETVMFFGKPAGDGSEAPPHQDNSFQCWVPPLALTLTVAIDESTPENGVLIGQKGTHKLGLLPHHQSGVAGFSRRLTETVDTAAYPEVEFRMKPGDVCLHHINVIHRSSPNHSSRARRQLGIGYRSSLAQRDMAAFEAYQTQLNALHQKVS